MLHSQRPPSAISIDEDLYSGYNDYPAGFGSKAYEADELLHQALLNTAHGSKRAPGAAMRFGTSSGYREGTGVYLKTTDSSRRTPAHDAVARPMTAVRGAGYTSGGSRQMFDPLNQASKGPSPALERDETPEEKLRKMEQKVMQLVEEACAAAAKGDTRAALDNAKEASSRERSLIRLLEQAGLSEAHNIDLTFSVLFNLAHQYENNAMYSEALNTYKVITRNRMFNNASRLKINMANIYTRLGQLNRAIKLYRMALDQVPSAHKGLRLKIMHNIGLLFVKMGQYNDACMSFEFIMQEKPDFKTGLHLVLCYSALGDLDKMQRGFRLLLDVPLDIDDEYKYTSALDDSSTQVQIEALRNDALKKVERELKEQADRSIITASKLVAKASGLGFSWCVEALKSSNHTGLAGELELNKSIMYLEQKDVQSAIDTLRVLSDTVKMSSAAATNLSFIYFLQGDLEDAEKWAEEAREADSYNAGAFVNLGCCAYAQGKFDKARDLFLCALENDSSCVEALFDLGLTHKRQGNFEDALDSFLKLQSIVGHEPQVLYQVAHLQELMGDSEQAVEWFQQLLGTAPTDPGILQKMAELHRTDRQHALQYYLDASRYYPASVSAIEWLGSYYVEMQVAEKAVVHYERAALLQPAEPRWPLLVASCLRRSGRHQDALRHYQAVHRRFPEHLDCLNFLVRICSDLGMRAEAVDYAGLLKKAEKAKEVRERIGSSRPGSRRSLGSSRGGSAATGNAQPSPIGVEQGAYSVPNSAKNSASLQSRDFVFSEQMSPLLEHTTNKEKALEDEFLDDDIGPDLLPE